MRSKSGFQPSSVTVMKQGGALDRAAKSDLPDPRSVKCDQNVIRAHRYWRCKAVDCAEKSNPIHGWRHVNVKCEAHVMC